MFCDNAIRGSSFDIGTSKFMSYESTNVYGDYDELRKELSLSFFGGVYENIIYVRYSCN